MHQPSILLLGATDRAEFQEARAAMDGGGPMRELAEMDAAVSALAAGEVVPEVIVVAQAFPGQVPHGTIDRLRRAAPLARIVGLLGSWCEGEMRSGAPWQGAVRTYWHHWPARGSRELHRLAAGQACAWGLPPTATEEERLLAGMAARWPRRNGVVVIQAKSPEMADWLSAAVRQRGFATVWLRTPDSAKVERAAAAIYDGARFGDEECAELRRLAAAVRPAPVLALLGFPRIEDQRRAIAAGATAVVSKPLSVDDLYWQLDRLGGE
jgi:CheY-like chemotaxis protein